MKFLSLANVMSELEAVSSGNRMREILSGFLKGAGSDIDVVCYLLLGSIVSKYDEVNIGMADKMVIRAISSVLGREVTSDYKKLGDVGLVAEEIVNKGSLSVRDVFNGLWKMAKSSGTGSQEAKISVLVQLLKKCSGLEARYLCRLVLGNLRLGVAEMTLLDSLSIAFTGSKKAKKTLESAYNTCPDIGIIAKTFVSKGVSGISRMGVLVGRPVQMMLAQRAKIISDVAHGGFPVAVEDKYDGERMQVHKDGSRIVIFSRRLENITRQFPDVVDAVRKNIKANKCIIEGECVPIARDGSVLAFQVLMQRKRKHAIAEYIKKVPVRLFLFDCLFYNGSILHRNYLFRYGLLGKMLKPNNVVVASRRSICSDLECVESFFNRAIGEGFEGVMVKSPNGGYSAGSRGWLWVKWKPEYNENLRDTFDLVVVGAFYGRGRRAGTYGALLCALYNEKEDRFETFCKLGSGFNDAELKMLPRRFAKVPHRNVRVLASDAMRPDVWFNPEIVVEVSGAQITRSPVHTAGLKDGVGLALRFPKFLRYREKAPEQATTVGECIGM